MHYEKSNVLKPIACSVKDVSQATGWGRDSIYRAMNEGKLASTTVGGRRLIFVDSLHALLEAGRHQAGGGA